MPKINVIGEGTYGCVHRPSITCKNLPHMKYKNKISKIMLDTEAEIELKEYAKIAKADIHSDFFLGFPVKCKTETNLENIRAINRCNNGKKIISNIKEYSLLVMRYGGINLEKFADDSAKWSKTHANIQKIDKFLAEFHRMLIGAQLFLKHDIIQHDVKPQNILYDQSENRMNYIDFGLMQSFKKTMQSIHNSSFWLAKKPHWSYPLEIQFMNSDKYAHFTKSSNTTKIDFYKEIVNSLNKNIKTKNTKSIRTLFSFILPKTNKEEFIKKYFNDFYKFCIHGMKPEKYHEISERCFKTVDGYGLGISMYYLVENIRHVLDQSLYKDLQDFAYKLITPNLNDRYLIEDAIFAYEEILESNGVLKRMHKEFKNHVLVDGNSNGELIKKKIQILSHKNLTLSRSNRDKIVYKTNRRCPEKYEYNRKTQKCVKHCKPGYIRDDRFKCIVEE